MGKIRVISANNKQNKQSILVIEQKLKIQYSKMRILAVVVVLAVLFVVSESTAVVQGSRCCGRIVNEVQSAAQGAADTAEQIAQQWADQAENLTQNLVDQGQEFVGSLATGLQQALTAGAPPA